MFGLYLLGIVICHYFPGIDRKKTRSRGGRGGRGLVN